MGRKKEACAECLQKCLQIHGKNKNSSTIFSFFKIMIGDQFTKVLYLPPKFAAMMSNSIDQTTFLEDSQGRQWKITTRSDNGTLSFDKGWSTFASNHDLQVGDFLVFSFIVGSHFFVKIYDRSACEKEISPRKNCSKKRTRSGRFDAIEVKSCSEHDNDSMNRPGPSRATISVPDIGKSPWFREKDEPNMNRSAKKPMRNEKNRVANPVCSDGLEEELCYIINRGIDYEREDERNPTANLFDLEMERNSSRTIGIAGDVLDKSLYHQLHAQFRTRIDENTSIKSGSGSQPIAENGSNKGSIKNNIALEDVDVKVKVLSIPRAIESKSSTQECHGVGEVMKFQIDKVKGNLVSTPSRNNPFEVYREEHSSFINSCQTIKHNIIPELNLFIPPNPLVAHNFQHGLMGKNIKKEQVEMTSGEIGKIIKKERVEVTSVEVCKNIKEELEEMSPGLFEDEEKLNIMVNCQNPFMIARDDNEVDKEIGLEVSNSLPSEAVVSCTVAENRSFLKLPSGREMRWKKKIVFLQDSMERLWPVLNQETPDFNILTSGWEAFCMANDIQAGQECVFKVENEVEGIYRVCIRRNS